MSTERNHAMVHRPWRGGRASVTGLLVAAAAAASFFLGFQLGTSNVGTTGPSVDPVGEAQEWTCSMHPEIRSRQPGKCPICGMDLIPIVSESELRPSRPAKYACAMMCIPPLNHPGKCPVCGMDMVPVEDGATGGSEATDSATLSPRAQRLAQLRLAPVERRHVALDVRLFGKLDFDETRTRALSARVAGRLDTLYVNYTGVPVRRGEHLISLYSPELLTAQEELLQAVRGVRESDSIGISALRDAALQTLASTRTKLLLWGLTPEQLDEIERRGTPDDHVTVFAPIGGIVLEKQAVEGAYVEMGERLFTIGDVTQLWARLEAYESDLPWLRYGQDVELRVEAYPGEVFSGRVAFLDPLVSEKTRTVGLRINLPNPMGRLKPGMFVHAVIRPQIDSEGRVLAPHLTGKWISPMHPEIVKDAPGTCDVCGMPLVSAESLGYATGDEHSVEAPLVIPTTAPLLTGKRAVVYVSDPQQPGTYESREIELGPRAGEFYLVRSGLREGEFVVAQGVLRVDSAVQILARRSMMNPAQDDPPKRATIPPDPSSTWELDGLLQEYFPIHHALAHDRFADAVTAARRLSNAEPRVLAAEGRRLGEAPDLAAARIVFHSLSDRVIELVKRNRSSFSGALRLYHCPMAFDNSGADWLQNKTGIENPYFGSAMFTCGVLEETIQPQRN